MRTSRAAAARAVFRNAAFVSVLAVSFEAAAHQEASPTQPEPVAPSSTAPSMPSVAALPPLEADDSTELERFTPFARRRVRLSLLVGTSSTNRGSYLILGGGIGYFLLNGFEVGIDYEDWLLGEPIVHRLSPETRYVFHFVPTLKPYVGVFYRHTFVNDVADLDHLGARTGVLYVPPTGQFYLGGGAAYERLLNCKPGVLVDCNAVYPELLVGISI
jgi:hypothetical protein